VQVSGSSVGFGGQYISDNIGHILSPLTVSKTLNYCSSLEYINVTYNTDDFSAKHFIKEAFKWNSYVNIVYFVL